MKNYFHFIKNVLKTSTLETIIITSVNVTARLITYCEDIMGACEPFFNLNFALGMK
jgi:hypothetical protein